VINTHEFNSLQATKRELVLSTMETSPNNTASSSRGKALICLGFHKGAPCGAKAVVGGLSCGTVCRSNECIAMRDNNMHHHQQYTQYKNSGLFEEAESFRDSCLEIYKLKYETRISRMASENMRLHYAEELQAAIDSATAKEEADEADKLLASLQTMSLDELKATQAAALEEYGFGAMMGVVDEQLDY
jgi:hypothetical protein